MEFEYDSNGNILIKKDEDFYMIQIDKNDDVYFEKIYNKIYNENLIKVNKIDSNILNKLHSKSMEEATNEIDHNLDLEDFSEDQIQDIADTYNEIKINPEYQSYKNYEYDLDDECYDNEECNEFEIFTNEIKNSNLIYEPPCFETILYKNNMVQLRTQLINNQPFYRISIHLEGKIQLNIIGSKIKFYSFNLNTIEINKLDESTIKIM
jgi:hypothetical protein